MLPLNLGKVLELLLSQNCQYSFPPLGMGDYYSERQLDKIRTFDPGVEISETLHRWRVLGSLVIKEGKIPLQITRIGNIQSEASRMLRTNSVGSWKMTPDGISIQCFDGTILVGRINYLPSLMFVWAVPRVISSSCGIH